MSWRRTGDKDTAPVEEVTLRNDINALSLLFQYGINHNWCRRNPTEGIDKPSHQDAVRIHVITPGEEMQYFETVVMLERENLAKAAATKRNGTYLRAARDYRALPDIATLMILQRPRPEEVMGGAVKEVDLRNGRWLIAKGKSKAARRWLKLLQKSKSILELRCANPVWLFPGKKPGTHLT